MPQTRAVTSQEELKKQIGMNANKNRALSEGRCFKCFERGHLARDCPNQDLRIRWTDEQIDSPEESKEGNPIMTEFMRQMQTFMTATTTAISELQQKQQKEKDF